MFTVNDYQISFRKSHLLIISKDRGRFDTICEISSNHSEHFCIYKGTAYLHPNDSPDKITGKKVALTKALIERIEIKELPNGTKLKRIHWHVDKQIRTEIWKAFWTWVESWKKREPVKIFDNIEEVKK